MNYTLVEPLETRQLLSASFIDTSYGTTGVATFRVKVPAGDHGIGLEKIAVDSLGLAYVLVETDQTIQIRRLTAAGALDTTWASAKHGRLAFVPISKETPQIAVDSVGRLLVLNGTTLYRFTAAGMSDTAFAGSGSVKLSDFTGQVQFDVDASNRVYLTGVTSTGAFQIDRLISRGKFDATFGTAGRVMPKVPPAVRELTTPRAIGRDVRVRADGKVFAVAQYISAGFSDGLEAVRLNANGSTDSTYGVRGTATVLPHKNPTGVSSSENPVLDGIDTTGDISYQVVDFNADNPTPTSYFRISADGELQGGTSSVTSSKAEPDGGQLFINGVTGNFVRTLSNGSLENNFNAGHPLQGSGFGLTGNGTLLQLLNSSRPGSVVDVARYQANIDPANV